MELIMNDKELESKICCDCGSTVMVSHGHARRMPSDHKWRCKSCMSKYRSELQKKSDTNIGIISKQLLSDPNTRDWYRSILSNNGKNSWNNKSEEERKKWESKFREGNKKYYQSISRDELVERGKRLSEYNSNKSDEEKQLHSDRISKSRIEYFRNMTSDEKERLSKLYTDIWNKKSDDEKDKLAKAVSEYWTNLSDEERIARIKQLSDENIKRWNNATDEYRYNFGRKISESCQNRSDDYRREISEKQQARWRNMSDFQKYDILSRSAMMANGNNKLHKRFEESFRSSYMCNNFYLKGEELTSNQTSHRWDYGIYNKSSNELVMVVDLDGSYFHADNCDYDGEHSHEEYDEKRYLSIPDNIKFYIIYEDKFSESFREFIKALNIDYDDFIENIFSICRSIPFPTPKYKNIELIKSYNDVLKLRLDKPLSLNTRVGDRLIQHFHESIYHAHTKGSISPYEAWHNDELLRKVIENRVIYQNYLNPNKILQGFNISKIAPKVSVFSAGRAKLLIHKYLSEYDAIFDPFSGFSGRMLGTVSLGKKYIGQDISDIHVRESNNMITFLRSNGIELDAMVTQLDVLNSTGEYPCLFTCPPYSDKEQWLDVLPSKRSCDDWIDMCINNFKCNRYLFVVDNTERYKDYVIYIINNRSHFNSNNEYVIMV